MRTARFPVFLLFPVLALLALPPAAAATEPGTFAAALASAAKADKPLIIDFYTDW